ncbi:MAG: hypothetical protein HW387_976 [Parachlamydiales bacterium]|nr:hypothetical protein [Parachlamydiales bacterium]
MEIILKNDSFNRNYDKLINTVDEDDRLLLDRASVTSHIYFNERRMSFPRFHRGEVFQLPFSEFRIEKYSNATFHINTSVGYSGEGDQIKVLNETTFSNHDCSDVFSAINCFGFIWQHVLQDSLPIIYFGREYLISHPQTAILMHSLRSPERNAQICHIIKLMGITNKIIFLRPYYKQTMSVKSLVVLRSNNEVPCWWWPNFFYHGINQFIKGKDSNRSNVILIRRTDRSSQSRYVLNHEDLKKMVINYCRDKGLNFVEFFLEKYPNFRQRYFVFQNAHTIIAPHGGANYHVLFSPEQTKFIEFCAANELNSLYNIASALNFKYFILPCLTDESNHNFNVDAKKVSKALLM